MNLDTLFLEKITSFKKLFILELKNFLNEYSCVNL